MMKYDDYIAIPKEKRTRVLFGEMSEEDQKKYKNKQMCGIFPPFAEEIIPQADDTTSYLSSQFFADVQNLKATGTRKTGFPLLDKAIKATTGLYTIGAGTATGKTTFALQIADNIATQGYNVIYFSIEMTRLEVVSKSLSRYSFINGGKNSKNAYTAYQIRTGQANETAVNNAIEAYKRDIADRISIVQGNFEYSIQNIKDYCEEYIKQHKDSKPPVIIIDYLQIIEPDNDRTNNQRATIEANVKQLESYLKANNILAFVLSAVPRSAYYQPFDVGNLKESGTIEFSCDAVIGMQYAIISEPTTNQNNIINSKDKSKPTYKEIFENSSFASKRPELIDRAKANNPRIIEIIVPKTRADGKTARIYYRYYSAFDYFEELPDRPKGTDYTNK